ncbi:O-antigen ligase family protein [Vibrio europaeus]|uniref:O-antigen ligase family protein n=1 Tax=Vibrio europaeus TaxID=300876 RepID=UPI002340652B|nr:O-antigen ligase family protein [Vibrio europaeus]MDC5852101.1 O-antigen ligase family protein [Vibrio europaeus]
MHTNFYSNDFIRSSLIYLLLFRASLDPVLELTKYKLGIGLGAGLNLMVIFIGLTYMFRFKFLLPKIAVFAWSGFLLAGFLSIFYSPVPVNSARAWLSYITFFMMFVIPFYSIKGRGDFQFFLKVLLISSFIPVAYTFVELFIIGAENGINGLRVKSTFSHPNMFAFYLVVMISIMFYLFKTKEQNMAPFSGRFMAVFLAFLLLCLVLTNTRSAWIGLLLLFFMFGLFFERRYIAYLAVFACVSFTIPAVQDRILDLFTGNDLDAFSTERLNSFAWRKLLWISSLDFIEREWLFGYGLETFKHYMPYFFPVDTDGKLFNAHNVYVELLFGLGVLGLSLYLVLYIVVILNLIRVRYKDETGVMLTCFLLVSYIVISYSDNMLGYLVVNWYFWFFIGCVCAYRINPFNYR